MASNRELIEQAKALGGQLGASVETQGLNNASLMALVADLQSKLSAGIPALDNMATPKIDPSSMPRPYATPTMDAKPIFPEQIPVGPPEKPREYDDSEDDLLRGGKVAAPPVITQFEYTIAPGKAIVTKRGVLAQLTEIFPSDLSDGIDGIRHHIAIGCVVHNPQAKQTK